MHFANIFRRNENCPRSNPSSTHRPALGKQLLITIFEPGK